MEEYVVQFGDTLSSIAAKKFGNGKRWNEIARLNNLTEPYTLFVGQRLKLPQTTNSQPNISSQENIISAPQTDQETPASLALARG